MKSRSISISPLVVALTVGASGVARAAECPEVHPISGSFRAIQVASGTVISYPPQTSSIPAGNTASIQRGLTLSGSITGLDPEAADQEMGLSVQLDLVRFTGGGQGYGTGEITINSRPPVPFISASVAYRGRVNAIVTASNQLTGYFTAVGDGDFAGATLRGRFTATLGTATAERNPPPNPFGGGATNPLSPGDIGGGMGPFSPGAPPTNPLAPGAGAPSNPLLPTTPGTTPATPVTAIEITGQFGGPTAPAVMVENDPMAILPMAAAPDLTPATTGLFPLVQPTTAKLTALLTGGTVALCPGGAAAMRTKTAGKGTIALKSGRSKASYRAELSFDACYTAGDFGYAEGRIRLFSKGTTVVYEGAVDGVVTPLIQRGRVVPNRFVWSGFLALNVPTANGAVVDSLRSVFTAVGTISRGRPSPIRLEAALGDAGDPFMRVMSGVSAR